MAHYSMTALRQPTWAWTAPGSLPARRLVHAVVHAASLRYRERTAIEFLPIEPLDATLAIALSGTR